MIWSYSGIELRTLFTCVIAEMPDHPAGRLSIVRLRQCDHCNREYAPSPQCLHDRWRITGTRVDGSERRNGRNSLSVKRLNQKSRHHHVRNSLCAEFESLPPSQSHVFAKILSDFSDFWPTDSDVTFSSVISTSVYGCRRGGRASVFERISRRFARKPQDVAAAD